MFQHSFSEIIRDLVLRKSVWKLDCLFEPVEIKSFLFSKFDYITHTYEIINANRMTCGPMVL